MTLSAVVFWVLAGLAFDVLITSLPGASVPWQQSMGALALAWLAGFLVIVLPAGLGVRESVLALLLSVSLPEGQAVVVAVLARLWWLCAEAPWIVIGVALLRVLPPGATLEIDPCDE
jgi:uncharacterized membrane protein YbhN (UPF0104 family)